MHEFGLGFMSTIMFHAMPPPPPLTSKKNLIYCTWTLYFNCQGGQQGLEFFQYEVERSNISFGNLLTMKSHLGYGVRDYLYYKKRCGNAVATLQEIDYDVDANE
jgi:hypothetical protein